MAESRSPPLLKCFQDGPSVHCRVDEDVIADAFEALVGAIYLDKGLKAASDFIIKLAEVC